MSSRVSVVVTTRKGKTVNGLVRKDTPEEVVLATGAEQEARIAREDIEDIQPSKVSVMPSGQCTCRVAVIVPVTPPGTVLVASVDAPLASGEL